MTLLGIDTTHLPLSALRIAHPEADQVIQATAAALCSVCHTPLVTHQRCRGCEVLIGPGHVQSASRNGYCSSCVAERRRRRR